jgi:hypothetical protein
MINFFDDTAERPEEGDIDMNSQDLTVKNVPQAENPNVENVEQPQPELRMDLTDDLLYLVRSTLKFCFISIRSQCGRKLIMD